MKVAMSFVMFIVIQEYLIRQYANTLWQCHGLNGNINITEGK